MQCFDGSGPGVNVIYVAPVAKIPLNKASISRPQVARNEGIKNEKKQCVTRCWRHCRGRSIRACEQCLPSRSSVPALMRPRAANCVDSVACEACAGPETQRR